jgi:anti-anti-sigma factor
MRIKLWGTRGSIPSPLRTEEIESKIRAALIAASEAGIDLADENALRAFVAHLPHPLRGTAGGDTSCVEVRSGGNLLILDCGSGLRRLGAELMTQEFGRGQGEAHIFISHTHWDHMLGWPFFVPGFVPGNRLHIYGVHPDLEERFRIQQTAPQMFPVPLDYQAASIEFIPLEEGQILQIGKTRISNMCFNHAGDSYGYRIEDEDAVLVYATDSEYKSLEPEDAAAFVAFFQNAEAVIFDAMFSLPESYRKEDWGHSSAIAGADLATRAGARNLLLFHHDPYASDEQIWSLRDIGEAYLRQHPERPSCRVIVAFDGLEMELWREARLEVTPEHHPAGTVLRLRGRLVEETVPIAMAALKKAAQNGDPQPTVLDLAEVAHIDSSGIAAMFTARRRWRPLALTGLHPEVRRILTQAGALDHLATFDTAEEAMAAMGRALALPPGRVLNRRYVITEQLEHSALGDLYRATDRGAQRQVTMLVLCPSLGSHVRDRLKQAASSVAEFRYPLISDVYDVGTDDGIHYIVSEYAPGAPLRHLIRTPATWGPITDSQTLQLNHAVSESQLSASQAVYIAAQIAQALAFIHEQNLVHGALSPDHITLLSDYSIKIAGMAVGRPEIEEPLTAVPFYIEPLDYLAPEQIQGHGNSPASDLYALGTILYEMVTGGPPFGRSENEENLMALKLRQAPVPPRRRNPNISRSLEHLILRLLERSPQDRPATAAMVYETLANLSTHGRLNPVWGRDHLLQKLQQHLARAAQGQSGLLVVRGGRGTGKTELVSNLAHFKVLDRQPVVLQAELFAHEDMRPYKLFVKALRDKLLRLPAHRLTQLLSELGDLGRPLITLIPELQPLLSSAPPMDASCALLEEALFQTLRLLTEQGPVVLILDSLQWIDPASLRLLDHLVRQRIPQVLIVWVYSAQRGVDLDPLSERLETLRPWIDEEISVRPLGPIDIHQMATALNPRAPQDFGLWLYSQTQGNPLHAEQLIQANIEGPSDTRHPQERLATNDLQDVILRRLENLPADTLTVLRQAAVIGHSFDLDALCNALDRPPTDVLPSLHPALQNSLLRGLPAEDRYTFCHPMLRETIYDEMLSGLRKSHHWRMAHILERSGASGPLDQKIDLLAHHLLYAEEYEKALTYLARAVRRARQLCATESALFYIDQALTVVERLYRAAGSEQEKQQRVKQKNDLLNARAKLDASTNGTSETEPAN